MLKLSPNSQDLKTLTEASQAALKRLADHTEAVPDGFVLKFTEKEIKSTYKPYGNYGKGWAHC